MNQNILRNIQNLYEQKRIEKIIPKVRSVHQELAQIVHKHIRNIHNKNIIEDHIYKKWSKNYARIVYYMRVNVRDVEIVVEKIPRPEITMIFGDNISTYFGGF